MDAHHGAYRARLFNSVVVAWCSHRNSGPHWLEVDFILTVFVIAVATQGDPKHANYPLSFKLKYRTNDITSDWFWVLDDKYTSEKVCY